MKTKPTAIFISHGGGPLPLLGDPGHQEMVSCLQTIANAIAKPAAIVVVSAHWETPVATITAAHNPELIYDYYGFPSESYDIQYPCPGSPSLAAKLHQMFLQAGIVAQLDESRGFDHGLFIPLKIMYPDADIPCVQLSLLKSLDPTAHIQLGTALHALTQENVLVIGSGFSFHNMKAFFTRDTDETRHLNRAFENWLMDICANQTYSEMQRRDLLIRWQDAEGARYCHPREEHLLPLHVCYGIAQGPATKTYSINIMNKQSSMFVW